MSYQNVKDKLYHGHRKVANNTYLELRHQSIATLEGGWTDEEFITMRLYGNVVAEFYPDRLELYSAGHCTRNTKSRLNLALELAGLSFPFRIYQRDWTWYYQPPNKRTDKYEILFGNGMKLSYNGEVL